MDRPYSSALARPDSISAPVPEYLAMEGNNDLVAGPEIAVPPAVRAEHAAQGGAQRSRAISVDAELDEGPQLRLARLGVPGRGPVDPGDCQGDVLQGQPGLETLSQQSPRPGVSVAAHHRQLLGLRACRLVRMTVTSMPS